MAISRESHDRRREALYAQLAEEYRGRWPRSAAFQERAVGRLVDGGSHALRLYEPFPFWVQAARGAYLYDLDGHAILDYWQGHYANILGHNPPEIATGLEEALRSGHGLQCGAQEVNEWELADLLCRRVGAEKIRFTTSGTLATMYAIMSSRTATGRSLVLKAGGGWHGAQPWGLKGVNFGRDGYEAEESEGLTKEATEEVVVTRFNDVPALEEVFRRQGEQVACFIVEPWMGSGGGIAATPEFLRRARELTAQHGALLILDEVIAGFRFHAGALGALYGVEPDLITLGKIIGGGMPVAAVAGRADILDLCGRPGGRRVRFDGGTYSGHPLSLLAGRLMVQYLVEHESEVYPRLGAMGARLRRGLAEAFAAEGIGVHIGGDPGPVIPGSSLAMLSFPYGPDFTGDSPDVLNDPALSDVALRERVLILALILEGVFSVHPLGALSTAHGEEDLEKTEAEVRAVARRFSAAGLTFPLR